MEDFKKAILVRNGTAVGAVGDKNFSTAPLGTVLSFAGQTAPHGYLLCDGASYKVTDYPHLYAVIGNTYGGDTENFNVPNLVDKFIQGSNTSGTEKEAGLPNIEGSVGYLKSVANKDLTNEWNGAFKWTTYSATSNIPSQTNSANSYDLEFDASKSNAIYGNSDTVQPPALTMVYIIKAFHTNEGTDEGLSDEVINYVDNKVETELKISSNTDTVHITVLSDIPFLSKGDNYCYYKIINGICYFQLFIDSTADVTTYTELCNSLPKPSLASVYFGFPTFYNINDVYKTLQVYISEDGVMSVNNSTTNASYMLNGSYPIA